MAYLLPQSYFLGSMVYVAHNEVRLYQFLNPFDRSTAMKDLHMMKPKECIQYDDYHHLSIKYDVHHIVLLKL